MPKKFAGRLSKNLRMRGKNKREKEFLYFQGQLIR